LAAIDHPLPEEAVVLVAALRRVKFAEIEVDAVDADDSLSRGTMQAVFRNPYTIC
jgi:hypothetical protein